MQQSIGRSSRPRLEIVVAMGVIAAAFLPFISLSFPGLDSGVDFPFSFSFTLAQLVNVDLFSIGGLLVAVGGTAACTTALYRTVQAWPGRDSAVVGLVAFAAFIGGLLAFASEWGFSAGFVLSIGFWAELVIGSAGVVICLYNLAKPTPKPYAYPAPYWQAGWQGPWTPPQPQWPGQQWPGQQWPPNTQPGSSPNTQPGSQPNPPQYWPPNTQPGWPPNTQPGWPQQFGPPPYGAASPAALPQQGPGTSNPESKPGQAAPAGDAAATGEPGPDA